MTPALTIWTHPRERPHSLLCAYISLYICPTLILTRDFSQTFLYSRVHEHVKTRIVPVFYSQAVYTETNQSTACTKFPPKSGPLILSTASRNVVKNFVTFGPPNRDLNSSHASQYSKNILFMIFLFTWSSNEIGERSMNIDKGRDSYFPKSFYKQRQCSHFTKILFDNSLVTQYPTSNTPLWLPVSYVIKNK